MSTAHTARARVIRPSAGVAALVAAALVLAACGGSGGGGHPAAGSAASVNASRPSARFVGRLSGQAEVPRGATGGRGDAIVALHDAAREICWRFAHLHGFQIATGAELARGSAGRRGTMVLALSAGPRLHHRGCVRAAAGLMSAIAADPGGYYVTVRSAGYPGGAVRAQL